MAEMISKTQIVATFPGLLPNFSDSSSAAISDFEMDKIAWQKKSRPASGFATKDT